MSSIQERLQLKREPFDKWSVREQLCLASAVARSGDQNWMSVSRSLKPFGEPNRPMDWFHQKNCAAQYGSLLSNVETPKRKKCRTSTGADVVETPTEIIMKRLLADRIAELKKLLAEEKTEYQKIKHDLTVLQSGNVSEEQLDIWCKEIDEEEQLQEQQAAEHQRWLKEREMRKQEIERVWRPSKPAAFSSPHKRKNSDAFEDANMVIESDDSSSRGSSGSISQQTTQQQQLQQQYLQMQAAQEQNSKQPATSTSPLLTSLLKSPSQVQSMIQQSSILHTAITSQSPQKQQSQNPTIASLLGSSANLQVSQGLQNLVASALTPDHLDTKASDQGPALAVDILDDEKIDDLANSILEDQDGPLPEIKKEEVDDIISEIIENAHDIVADPEQHLQLDGNGDIKIDLLDNLEDDEIIPVSDSSDTPDNPKKMEVKIEEETKAETEPEIPIPKTPEKCEKPPNKEKEKVLETPKTPKTPKSTPAPVVDPFEFQEDDPVIFDPPKSTLSKQDISAPHTPLYQQQSYSKADEKKVSEKKELDKLGVEKIPDSPKPEERRPEPITPGSRHQSGTVEIVEVIGDDDNSETELNESQIQDIVHSLDTSIAAEGQQEELPKAPLVEADKEIKEEIKEEPPDVIDTEESNLSLNQYNPSTNKQDEKTTKGPDTQTKKSDDASCDVKHEKPDIQVKVEEEETKIDDLYDMPMEVKFDKTGKTKRDYSRTKRNQDKSFDVLLAIEKSQYEELDLEETQSSDNTVDSEKKDIKPRLKSENERSSSPWTTEEEEPTGAKGGNRRRLSTPGTPMESYPNSPASSTFYEHDDRDYRNWKKSVMLVYNRLASNKYASLFLKPITENEAPGYSGVVYRPIDLQTIKKNIDNGTIRTSLEFKRDVMLMFQNAIMYNKTGDTIYNMAVQMQQESLEPIEILLQAQGEVSAPSRRETRTSESSSKRKRPMEDNIKNKKRKED